MEEHCLLHPRIADTLGVILKNLHNNPIVTRRHCVACNYFGPFSVQEYEYQKRPLSMGAI